MAGITLPAVAYSRCLHRHPQCMSEAVNTEESRRVQIMGGTRIFDVAGQRGGKAEGMGATENRHCRTLNRVKPSYANLQ